MTDEEMDRIENRLDFAERDGWDLLAALREERAARLKAEAERDAMRAWQADARSAWAKFLRAPTDAESDDQFREAARAEASAGDEARAERADMRARLSRAREALADFDEEQPHYRDGKEAEDNWRARQESALVALRAALAEPLGGP